MQEKGDRPRTEPPAGGGRDRLAADSWASSTASRNTMRANRRRDTKPELAVRRILHAAGLRYRVDFRPDESIRSRADIVFTAVKLAVFIDGCFWHGCPEHFVAPKSNPDYWGPKIQGNMCRDIRTARLLVSAGWHVRRYWEHEDPAKTATSIIEVVADLRVGD